MRLLMLHLGLRGWSGPRLSLLSTPEFDPSPCPLNQNLLFFITFLSLFQDTLHRIGFAPVRTNNAAGL